MVVSSGEIREDERSRSSLCVGRIDIDGIVEEAALEASVKKCGMFASLNRDGTSNRIPCHHQQIL